MLYCPKCQILAPEKCPLCERKTREPLENDPVLLLIADNLRADMAEPILNASGIPYARMGERGAGLTMYSSPTLETFRFYVPFGAAKRARQLLADTFGEDRNFMERLIQEIE